MEETATKKAIDLNSQCVEKFKQGKFKEAIKIGSQALELLLQSDADINDIAICYYNLGSSYLKLYENARTQIFSALSESKHLVAASEYLKKALVAYKKLHKAEAITKTEDKVNICFKYMLWNKLTSLQRNTFKVRDLKPIHIAVLLNDLSQVQELYAKDDKCLEQCDELGWPPLIYALFFKASPNLVNFLIEKSAQFLTKNYGPLAFTTVHNYYAENYGVVSDSDSDEESSLQTFHKDEKSGNLLDEDEDYPPIYYTLVRPKIIKNLIGTWSNKELINIIQLLIAIAPKQLQLVEDVDDEENCCALVKALACKAPEEVVKVLIHHTPQETLTESGAINIALKSSFSNEIIELLLEHTPDNVLEEKCVLVNALEQHYPINVIACIIDKNPSSVKKTDLGVPPLFAAIYSKADIDVIKMLFEKDPDAALRLAGASMLGYWDDGEFEPGYNVTSLIMALYVDRFDIAAFLLQQRPELVHIKDDERRLPISYIDLKRVPLEFFKEFLTLGLSSLYKEEGYRNTLLTHNRKEIAYIALKLGLAIGVNLSETVTDIDTTDCIVIGLSINGETVTRQTPGFSQSITNLEELANACKQKRVLKTDEDFEHYIKLVQLMLLSKKESPQKKYINDYLKDNETSGNYHLLAKFEKWLILNKPNDSLTHLCLRFIRNNYTQSRIDEAKNELPETLFKKLHL